MTVSKAMLRSVVGVALILAVIGGSPMFAAGDVVHKGVDLWMTVAGFAQTSFADQPIPAGFFCEGSQPFTGKVKFQGAPLAVEPAGSLGSIDTVVSRLDDAAFDAKGEATTRIQLMALSLVSLQPIETSCGKYNVSVNLAGEQPKTLMHIFRTDAFGGTYTAPLALNVKAVFTPVNGNLSGRREVTRRIDLGPGTNSVWAYVNLPRYKQGVAVDTNGDGKPDTVLPASSNFLAGVSPAVLKAPPALPRLAASTQTTTQTASPVIACPVGQCAYQSCHCAPPDQVPAPAWNQSSTGCASDHLHCIWTCAPSTACLATAQPVDGTDVHTID
ncbi:MAG TPA: hypothetical protein VIE43_00025 [Thermoanaerobaculia bacterium]|nr:hypothetical protein [Thermoanaerobaculia bacterium]